MEIRTLRNGSELTVILSGRLDTLTSPDLEDKLEEELDGVEKLIFDLSELDYISSAGLRVLVGAYQEMSSLDGMIIRSPGTEVMEVFEITGLVQAFVFE